MGGADGAGTTSTASVDQFNFRRTPITSGDVTANHEFWQQKEAEYNALDPRSQAQLLRDMEHAKLLEQDWNHLVEVPIHGTDGPLKELVKRYPKLINEDGPFFVAPIQDVRSIRRVYGSLSTGAFRNGPIFPDTRIDVNMFDEILLNFLQPRMMLSPMMQSPMMQSPMMASPNSVSGGEMRLPQPVSRVPENPPLIPPGFQHEISPFILHGLQQLGLAAAGGNGRLDVGQFTAPAIGHESQSRFVGRPIVNNQAPEHQRQNNFHNNNRGGKRGGFLNRGMNRQMLEQQQKGRMNNNANNNNNSNSNNTNTTNTGGNAPSSTGSITPSRSSTSVTPLVSRPPTPPSQENRREQVVPIQVVVVDRQNGENVPAASNGDSAGTYTMTCRYRQWRGNRFNNGNNQAGAPNKIHFNRV